MPSSFQSSRWDRDKALCKLIGSEVAYVASELGWSYPVRMGNGHMFTTWRDAQGELRRDEDGKPYSITFGSTPSKSSRGGVANKKVASDLRKAVGAEEYNKCVAQGFRG